MTLVELTEHGLPVELRCGATQGRALATSGVVDARPAAYGDEVWLIADAGKVGVARVGDMEIRIRPKVRVDRLLFLLGYLINPRGWCEDTVNLETVDELVPALAQSLWRQAERARLHVDCCRVTANTRRPVPSYVAGYANPTRCGVVLVCPSRWKYATTSSRPTSLKTGSCVPASIECWRCRASTPNRDGSYASSACGWPTSPPSLRAPRCRSGNRTA